MEYDVAIIGAGITGLNVAASLIERHPDWKIAVYERSVIPYGASTRNAGFACFGSLSEILSDADQMGRSAAIQLVIDRFEGLQMLRKRLSDEAIGFEGTGGFELVDARADQMLDQLPLINRELEHIIPGYIAMATQRKDELGIAAEGELLSYRGEGQVNTAMLMQALESYVTRRGVILRLGADIKSVNKMSDHALLILEDVQRGEVRIKANHVVHCTNAFIKRTFAELDVEPGRGQVFISKPILDFQFRGNLHMHRGFYYLRNVGNRLLVGGGRHLDLERERTDSMEINDEIQLHLEQKSREVFGAEFSFEVENRWSGIMAFGTSKSPIVKKIGDREVIAARLGGMGIALATLVGEKVADMIE